VAFLVSYVGFPLPAIISIHRAGSRIRAAQKAANVAQQSMRVWFLVPGLLVSPLVFAYLQKQMNTLWAVEGRSLPEAPSTPVMWERVRKSIIREF
jgi:hypothetical protein